MAAQELSLRIQNLTPFDSEVKLLYTGTEDPNFNVPYYDSLGNIVTPTGTNISPVNNQRIGWDTTPKIKQEIITYPAQWGSAFPTPFAFQNADGDIWVTDGVTLPFAFNTAFTFKVDFVYGITLVSHTVNVTVGMAIDQMLRLSAEGIRDALVAATALTIDEAQLLGNATPIGILMAYDIHPTFNTNTLALKLITTNNPAGNPGSYQQVTIGTQAALLFTQSDVANGFNIQEGGWTKYIVASDRSGRTYLELLNSLSNQSILTETLVRYSNNTQQINEPISWKKYNSSGKEATYVETGVVDPYQGQASSKIHSDIVVDGQVYAEFKILAGEFLDITIYYETAGILHSEQIETLERLLHEQNMDDATLSKEKEINEIYREGTENISDTFLNFSGSSASKFKPKLLVGLILLIFILRKNASTTN